jgi:hypothetical protein
MNHQTFHQSFYLLKWNLRLEHQLQQPGLLIQATFAELLSIPNLSKLQLELVFPKDAKIAAFVGYQNFLY